MPKLLFLNLVMAVLSMPESQARVVWEESTRKDLDPITISSIIYTETGGTFNPRAYNRGSGTIGLMQLKPFWGRWAGYPRREMFDEKTNIVIGTSVKQYLNDIFPRTCRRMYNRAQCRNRYRPLHLYRCRWRSIHQRGCTRSVRSVASVERRLRRSLGEL